MTTPIRLETVDARSGRPVPGAQAVEEDILHNEPLGPQLDWEHVWPTTDSNGMTKRDVPLGMLNEIDIAAEGYQLARITAAWEKSGWGRLIENVVDVETPTKKFNDGYGPTERHSTNDVIVIRLYPIKPAEPG